jgi:hypothetical protein
MKAAKESEETAIWAKVAFAFVAGLVLAGAGALIVVRSLEPKAGTQVANQNASAPADPADSAPQATPAETETQPQTRKGHSDASANQPSKRHATEDRAAAPTTQGQEQAAPAAPQQDVQPPGGAQQPQYAPVPDVAQVTPETPLPAAQAAQPSQPRQPQTVTIAAGTNLTVRLGEAISTKDKVAGDSFRGTLEQPVVMNGFVIADKGSPVTGRVVSAQRGGHLSGSSGMSLQVTEINTTDRQTVRVQTSPWEKKGESNTAGNVAKIGGGAAVGAIIGAIAGGGKGAAIGAAGGGAAGTGVAAATGGKPTVVPIETLITFRLAAPVTITEQIIN